MIFQLTGLCVVLCLRKSHNTHSVCTYPVLCTQWDYVHSGCPVHSVCVCAYYYYWLSTLYFVCGQCAPCSTYVHTYVVCAHTYLCSVSALLSMQVVCTCYTLCLECASEVLHGCLCIVHVTYVQSHLVYPTLVYLKTSFIQHWFI